MGSPTPVICGKTCQCEGNDGQELPQLRGKPNATGSGDLHSRGTDPCVINGSLSPVPLLKFNRELGARLYFRLRNIVDVEDYPAG